jgi:basic amino acid/polyamine antiporter, APA family
VRDVQQENEARPLGLFSLFTLGLNGIVGVGIFFSPAEVARAAPPGRSVGVFALTALLLVPVALVFVALSRRFDEDGGPVLYARVAFPPWLAFAVGWMSYLSAIASTASTCAGLAHALVAGSSSVMERAVGLALATVLALLCAAGIVFSARVWSVFTVLKMIPLLALAAAAVVFAPQATAPPEPIRDGSWLAGALVATFAFQGFEIVPVVAGQAKASRRIVPAALLGSLAVAAALYLVLQSACVRGLGGGLPSSPAPLADAAAAFGGSSMRRLIVAGTSLSALGIAFGYMAMTPRYLASLAEQETLGFDLHERPARGVPLRALAITWALVSALVAVLGARLGELLELSSVAVLCQYVSAAGALGWLALRRLHGFRRSDAWLALPALVAPALLLSHGTPSEWATAAGALALGFVLRFVGARKAA